MDRFTTLSGVAAPLMRANIDTDTIIRIERMTGTTPAQMGPWAFEALRFRADGSEDPDFVLNQAPFRDAPILLAGDNFGCGSSREGAVWALWHFGVRCVIAAGFGDIFANNCFQNGLLPVVLPAEQVAQLAAQCAGGNARITVDLHRQVVIAPHGQELPFQIEGLRREALLKGLDEIGLTLQLSEQINAFQIADRTQRPWVWQPGA
jgi:3-isopropylmalate/(R)-2-methylmalate dehydratase small subunit